MKKLGRLLLPVIMVGILVLSGRALLGATSDSTLGPSFKQVDNIPVDKAVAYIYRHYSGYSERAAPFNVEINGKVITTLVKDVYYAYFTEPGQIEFTGKFFGPMAPKATCSITVDVKAGQTYYLKGSVPKGGMMSLQPHLVLVSPEVGAKEIANCKLIMTTLDSTSGPISTSTPAKTAPSSSPDAQVPVSVASGVKTIIGTVESEQSLRGKVGLLLYIITDDGGKNAFYIRGHNSMFITADGQHTPIIQLQPEVYLRKKVEIKYSIIEDATGGLKSENGKNGVVSMRLVD